MISSEPQGARPEVTKKDRVLMIDDEPPMLAMYQAALSSSFEITTAANASEATRLLEQRAFKVVVADHLMPGETGMDFLVRMRKEFPRMQRVILSGYLKADLLLRSVTEADVFRSLSKPVPMRELVRVIQEAARAHDVAVAAK